jgi:hypothetical protein
MRIDYWTVSVRIELGHDVCLFERLQGAQRRFSPKVPRLDGDFCLALPNYEEESYDEEAPAL